MRTVIGIIAALCACKGGDKTATPATGSQAGSQAGSATGSSGNASAGEPLAQHVPKVDTPTTLALPTPTDKVPMLVLVEADGKLNVAVGPSKWSELGGFKVATTKPVEALDVLYMQLREGQALGKTPAQMFENWIEPDDLDLDLATIPSTQDDPPPPEEEDLPDDGEEESGGTGTAMALEEGKMGKKDSDRAEGQYKMKKNQDDPQLARQQAIEQARRAGILGSSSMARGGAFASLIDGPRDDVDYPVQLATIAGVVDEQNRLDEEGLAMIAAHPKAKATALIEVVGATRGVILVASGTEVRPLRLQFPRPRDVTSGIDSDRWIEVRVSPTEIIVEAVPNQPTMLGKPSEIAATYATLTATKGYQNASVDVLVSPEVDVQRLIEILVAVDVAGARSIGLGTVPAADDPQSKLRGQPMRRVYIGQPSAMGNIDKADIRRLVKENRLKLLACYETALAKQPELDGTVMVSFLITPQGKVSTATASGVDPDVATCVTKVVKAITFPKPKGGGATQVNYPFTFRRN